MGKKLKIVETKPAAEHVPEELVEEILSILPVKSLLRFKCVSKLWKSLIVSKRFVDKQLKISTKKIGFPNHRLIFLAPKPKPCEDVRVPKQYSLPSLLNDPSMAMAMDMASPRKYKPSSCIVGCCNGLVCIFEHKHVFLWNPATRIWLPKKFPKISDSGIIARLGFGWDESSGAYKVVAMVVDVSVTSYEAYSSKTNSWKTLEIEQGMMMMMNIPSYTNIIHKRRARGISIGTFACGKIHMLEPQKQGKGINIVSLDLKSDKFGMMRQPCNMNNNSCKDLRLQEIGGRLSMTCCHENSLNVWVMNEESSWFKLASIPLVCHKHGIPFSLVFGSGDPDGELLLLYRDTFSVYSPKDNNVISTCNYIARNSSYDVYGARVYVESLVSPKEYPGN